MRRRSMETPIGRRAALTDGGDMVRGLHAHIVVLARVGTDLGLLGRRGTRLAFIDCRRIYQQDIDDLRGTANEVFSTKVEKGDPPDEASSDAIIDEDLSQFYSRYAGIHSFGPGHLPGAGNYNSMNALNMYRVRISFGVVQ